LPYNYFSNLKSSIIIKIKMSSNFVKTFNKYLPNQENRKKFKRQCLKVKNILEENDSIQIGSKI